VHPADLRPLLHSDQLLLLASAWLTEPGSHPDKGGVSFQPAKGGEYSDGAYNTSLEDLHAGDHVTGGFPDSDMIRFNIATFHLVSEQVGPDRCEWDALEAMLTDPSRVLPGGVTIGALAGSEFEHLVSDVRNALSISRLIEQRRGFPFLLMVLALQAGMSNKEWYGSPWWPDIVNMFIELLDDPASSAWKYDEHREPVPSAASDRAALEEVLLEKPESLDD
jgi:hypothetical protein